MKLAMAVERLVHRVVEHFGEEMMECALIRAADIHAGPAPHRLEPFENLDILGGVGAIVLTGFSNKSLVRAVARAIKLTFTQNEKAARWANQRARRLIT